jgi:hypothetical protein
MGVQNCKERRLGHGILRLERDRTYNNGRLVLVIFFAHLMEPSLRHGVTNVVRELNEHETQSTMNLTDRNPIKRGDIHEVYYMTIGYGGCMLENHLSVPAFI